MMGWYGTGGGMGFGWIFMILFWVLVIVIVLGLGRWLIGMGPQRGGPPEKSARDILDERYARGEIGKAEYEEKRAALTKG